MANEMPSSGNMKRKVCEFQWRKSKPSVVVTFKALIPTKYGETVKVCGNHPSLGGWNPNEASALCASSYTNTYPVWSGQHVFETKTLLEFKFIKVDSSNNVTWEEGPNRTYIVPARSEELTLETSFSLSLGLNGVGIGNSLLQAPFSRNVYETKAGGSSKLSVCGTRETESVGDRKYKQFLPCLYANRRHELRRTLRDINAFLKEDLNVDRLNGMHWWLRLAGRPQAARPLHRQIMMNRSVVITEQADLHLTWNDSYIFIKPLPRYLLCTEFWNDYLCRDKELHARASGFLLSYAWLVCYECDYQLATKGDEGRCLIPSEVTWDSWQNLIRDFLDWVYPEMLHFSDAFHKINKRYEYGELRLGRLNKTYRFIPPWCFKHLIRGYHYGYHQYGDFFTRNFAWLIVVFAYITVVLTAMQVCLAIDSFKDDPKLDQASKGFAVFSMILVVVAVSAAALLFSVLFLFNLVKTICVYIKKSRANSKKECKVADAGAKVPVAKSQGLLGIFGRRRMERGDGIQV